MTGWLEYIQYRYALAVCGVLAGVMITLLAIVAVANPSEFPRSLFAYVPLALLLAMVVMTLVMRPWRYSADTTTMPVGGAWVHWTYDEASWRAASSYDQQRNRLSPARVPARARRAARGEIYISRRGIYWRPGGYLPLDRRWNIRYESADLVHRPTPHVHIEISEPMGSCWTRRTLTDVLVPPGREDEARTLVDLLRRHVLSPPDPHVCPVCTAREPLDMPEPHKWAPREPLGDG
jgi:hypothetical protein